ncbi:hypothetical protein GGS26DRAFT_585940 [Hypomontagnella submonticulosa]|nr:hypothetical protein GGS26DRAFT_585940 [Hypomontagnella submonticulosa]
MNSKIYLALCLATQVLGAAIHGADAVGLMKRDDDIQTLCGAPPNMPNTEFLVSDYAYPIDLLLSAGDTKLHVDAGPAKCKEAACGADGGAGVYICNDNTKPIEILFSDIAWFAQQVYNKCKVRRDGTDFISKGQSFCPDGWNVILADVGDHCDAPIPGQ